MPGFVLTKAAKADLKAIGSGFARKKLRKTACLQFFAYYGTHML